MSQRSSLTQSAHFVRQALTAYTGQGATRLLGEDATAAGGPELLGLAVKVLVRARHPCITNVRHSLPACRSIGRTGRSAASRCFMWTRGDLEQSVFQYSTRTVPLRSESRQPPHGVLNSPRNGGRQKYALISGLPQSLRQCPHVACELPQPPPRGDHLGGVPAMLVVAVAWPLGSARTWCATVHPAASSPGHDGRSARRPRACPGATPGRLPQLFRLLG